MQFWCDHRISVETRQGAECREIHIERPFALVGSHFNADVQLAGGQPKRAALLIVVGEEILYRPLENLGEGTATVTASGALRLNDMEIVPRIEVGRRNSTDLSPSWPIPVVEVIGPGSQAISYRLTRAVYLVGRHSANDIELRCREISVFHCALYVQQGRLWCIDLLSGNGTLLNGQRVKCQEIRLGEELKVGTYRLVFERYSRMKPARGPRNRPSVTPLLPAPSSCEEPDAPVPRLPQAAPQNVLPRQEYSNARTLIPVATVDELTVENRRSPIEPASAMQMAGLATDGSPAPTLSPNEDRLTHFVTNRLVEMDKWRKRRIVLMWLGGITGVVAVVLLCAGTIYWRLNT